MSATGILIVFIISFILILWAGRVLPRAIGGISRMLHLSEFITAFVLVSFATSVPELFIGIFSAIQNIPALSLGNIMGANFINLSLVVGASALFAGNIHADGKISSFNFWLASFIALLPLLLSVDGVISRGDGVILITIFIFYFMKIIRDREYFHKEMDGNKDRVAHSPMYVFKHFGRFLFAMVVLLIGSFVFIWAAKQIISEYFAAHFLLFGSLFVAIGTTLPEFVFGVRASLSGHGSAMLGNAIGTLPFNAAAIIGLVALIRPISIRFSSDLVVVSLFMIVAIALFHFFVYTKNHINRTEGIVLLLLYGVFFYITLTRCIECSI